MRRREFITIAGVATTWPLVARAQQSGERMRRIGVLMNTAASKDQQANVATFVQVLQQLGWTEGRNLQIDIRWAGGDPAEIRTQTEDLVASGPDVILVTGNAGMPPLLRATRTVPIIFNNVADPVGAGYVDTMARPGGNATGFIQFEYSLSGKWLAARHKLPAVYYRRVFVSGGGLMSYGYDAVQQFHDAAVYVDRILKGENPADLPVQAPTKYELVINLKTAKALGIAVPPSLLARADEVIE